MWTGLGGVAASLALAAAGPTGTSAAFEEAPCGEDDLQCSHVTVPLDRTGALPGSVALDVRRLPAGAAPTRTAFVVLLGGPGQVASASAPALAADLGGVRGDRDLVLFDERGVGGSGALRCPGLLRPSGSGALGCATRLGALRGEFTTAADVEDLEAIRVAGGYEQVVLYGASYGTKVALEYAAARPERVEALILDSTVTPEGPDPLQLSTFAALPRVVRSVCSGGACRGVTADPAGDVRRLARRLGRRPLRGRFVDADGRRRRATLSPADLLTILSAGDVDPVLRSAVPAAVHAALHGDPAAFVRLRAQLGGRDSRAAAAGGINRARFVATTCEETLFPWDRTAPPATRAAQAGARIRAMPRKRYAPFDWSTVIAAGILPLCVQWPVASPAPAPVTLPAGLRALLLAGGEDLRTPLEDAQAVAARLGPAAQVVVLPHAGHSVLGSDVSGCANAAVVAFLSGTPPGSCETVERLLDPARPAPRSVGSVPPYPGLHGRAGRIVTTASRTVADAARRRLSERVQGTGVRRFGGLRGGTASIEPDGLRLHGYVYVPRVAVTGIIPDDTMRPIELRIQAHGASGRIRAGGGRVTGRIGGRRISVSTSRTSAAAASFERDAVRGLAASPLRVP
ncbi:hypothetical protein DSM104329_01761 [Capillimicrobium parvum]|uniref:Alpha/beta fold hydrolase n=1 Tax=Capillimicrobium parvum TaxID=2884022 RepID=A0A9E6XVV1_9ACTN|nr:hypothetical protein DSM104329_01761 [Capillimicrobium parvum]